MPNQNIDYLGQSEWIRKQLRKAREELQLTQDEVANMLNKPQWFISRCESGSRRVDITELLELAKVYSKDISFFLLPPEG